MVRELPIQISDMVGSREFKSGLQRMGSPVKLRTLKQMPFADFAITMPRGPDGVPFEIGVERKTIVEMLGAVQDSRFIGHQLPGMITHYDAVIVVVEGWTTIDRASGCLMMGQWEAGFGGRHLYEPFKKFQITLAMKARVMLEPTRSKSETTHFLHALHRWAQKPWSQHKSAYKVESREVDAAILSERTMRRQTFAQWPHVGWYRSKRVSEYFPSVLDAAVASPDEWCAALGMKEPGKIVRDIRRFLRGKEVRDAKAS